MSRLVLQREGGWVRLVGSANRHFTEFLKYKLKPDSLRRYDITSGSWMVWHTTLRTVAGIARHCFSAVDWSTLPPEWQMLAAGAAEPPSAPAAAPAVENPFAVLFVTEDAPLEVVHAAFRALALTHHPDRGGSEAQFVRISSAYDRIKKIREH